MEINKVSISITPCLTLPFIQWCHFALLLAMLLAVGELSTVSGQGQCKSKSLVELSEVLGLRLHLLREQQNAIDYAKEKIRKETELELLENLINITVQKTQTLRTSSQRVSTPKMRELEKTPTCHARFPRNCCDVNTIEILALILHSIVVDKKNATIS
jgi:hypothetical protein